MAGLNLGRILPIPAEVYSLFSPFARAKNRIIIIIIIITTITFMQGIYTYIPATNYVPREYSVAVPIHGAYIASSSVECIALLH